MFTSPTIRHFFLDKWIVWRVSSNRSKNSRFNKSGGLYRTPIIRSCVSTHEFSMAFMLKLSLICYPLVLWYFHLSITVYNSRVLLLNVRRNFSSDQKVLEIFVLPVGDNRRFRIYLAESVALSYRYQCFIRTLFRLSVARLKVVMKGKPFLWSFCFVLKSLFMWWEFYLG